MEPCGCEQRLSLELPPLLQAAGQAAGQACSGVGWSHVGVSSALCWATGMSITGRAQRSTAHQTAHIPAASTGHASTGKPAHLQGQLVELCFSRLCRPLALGLCKAIQAIVGVAHQRQHRLCRRRGGGWGREVDGGQGWGAGLWMGREGDARATSSRQPCMRSCICYGAREQAPQEAQPPHFPLPRAPFALGSPPSAQPPKQPTPPQQLTLLTPLQLGGASSSPCRM